MNHTFWVGVSQNLTEDDMAKTLKVIHDFVEEKLANKKIAKRFL